MAMTPFNLLILTIILVNSVMAQFNEDAIIFPETNTAMGSCIRDSDETVGICTTLRNCKGFPKTVNNPGVIVDYCDFANEIVCCPIKNMKQPRLR